MPYQLQIIEKQTYLHAIVTGENTPENVAGYLKDLLRECGARQCFRAIAYVDVNAGGELMAFAETVATNRGVPMSLFATVAEAAAWLAGKPR